MKAALRGSNGLEFAERARPRPGDDDVLVRVRAAALNRADLGMLAGHMHGTLGGTGTPLGMEWAGEVVEVGRHAALHFKAGDRVMGSGTGAFAEYALADRGRVMALPQAGLSFEQAATLPIALQTMHDAIVTNGRLRAGESVLIQGASSGVGLMALQIARHLGAGRVIGSSTTADKRARLAEFGADLALDSGDPKWPEAVRDATGGGVQLIVDQLSGSLMNANMAAAAVLGRIVNVGRMAGMRADFDFDLHALKRIHYVGVTFRTRSVDEVREIVTRMTNDLGPALAAGTLRLPIAATFAFDRLGDAFTLMAANRHFGKIVVTLP